MKPTENGVIVRLLLLLAAGCNAYLLSASAAPQPQPFVHPGILETRGDLERMKKGLAANDPVITAGFAKLRNDPLSQSTYVMTTPAEEIGRPPTATAAQGPFNHDACAAYQNALLWCLTGEKPHADKAKEILHAWSAKLKRVVGRDGVLMAGITPFEMVNAAELMRYSNAGWSEADIHQCESMFTNAFYPEIKDFSLYANGNWDAAAEQTMFAIAVFCNDRAMFERVLRFYCHGGGDGSIMHYVINESGQGQESGRDYNHAQLGLGLLGDCCEVAWSQGLDLYGYADHRLLTGYEYAAKYLLGEEVPFVPMIDRTGKYPWERISGRAGFRVIYEQIYNHYVFRAGVPAPYIQRVVLEHTRPEGAESQHDHTGFGTLLYARSQAVSESAPVVAPVAPGAIVSVTSPAAIQLTWVGCVGADSYTVKRSGTPGGPYEVIAQSVKTNHYTDRSVQAGTVYYYVATAKNAAGESVDSWETGASAGPPTPWSHQDVGAVSLKGFTEFDGKMFTLDGGGTGMGSTNDQCQFAWRELKGDGTMTARFVPQVSGMLSSMGLMMRESLDTDSPQISLLITAQNRRNAESTGYGAQLQTRVSAGAATVDAGRSPRFGQPYSEQGRLLGYCWLRLTRSGDRFTASYSPDGSAWTEIPGTNLSLKPVLRVGLAVSSTQPRLTSTVMFDHVTVSDH